MFVLLRLGTISFILIGLSLITYFLRELHSSSIKSSHIASLSCISTSHLKMLSFSVDT